MRETRIRKRSNPLVAVGAVLAASAMLSAFQPVSAQVLETAWAQTSVYQGDFEISVGVRDGGGACAIIRKVVTNESHRACGYLYEAEVSDTLEYARGAGTLEWTDTSAPKGRGSKS
jgi:hypothetical protein